jgi:SAM-dependent methyltransferase
MTDDDSIRHAVREAYSGAARRPKGKHPFPVGRRFATSVGYPAKLIRTLPKKAVEAFSGVSNLAVASDINAGETVLDLGCGSGLDALVASRRVGPGGWVIGVDFSHAMLIRAGQAVREDGASNIQLVLAEGERIPLASGSVDVAVANGIFNLNPYRSELFHELARVVRKGGAVWAAELTLKYPLPQTERGDLSAWFA